MQVHMFSNTPTVSSFSLLAPYNFALKMTAAVKGLRASFPLKDSERDNSRPVGNFPGSGPFSGPPSEASPTKEFFGPIDGLKYFGQRRHSPPAHKKIQEPPFRSPYKDSPLTTNETHSTMKPKFSNRTTEDPEIWLNKSRNIRGAASAMETDVSVDLTVLPFDENHNSSTNAEAMKQAIDTNFLRRRICLHLPALMILSFSVILLIVLSSLITALCAIRRESLQRLKFTFCS
uniref:Uncharacterized protein n=1 Tax=Acrobeloides nanus TaxID=290746 RepID=A0A914E427_9BILA